MFILQCLLTYVNDKFFWFGYNYNVCQNRGGISITPQDFYQNIFHLKDRKLIQELVSATEIRYLKKGEFVVRLGEVQNDVYFMETGMARGYFLDVNGKDITDCFGFQCGTAVVAFGHLELDVPSLMTIEILEDSKFSVFRSLY